MSTPCDSSCDTFDEAWRRSSGLERPKTESNDLRITSPAPFPFLTTERRASRISRDAGALAPATQAVAKEDEMRTQILKGAGLAVVLGLLTLSAPAPVAAADIRASVPFSFTVNKKVLPP